MLLRPSVSNPAGTLSRHVVSFNTLCLLYTSGVPKLWKDTIDTHRAAVRDVTLDTAAALAAERGLTAVTMSEIAERAGIGRATLYKYFPDVASILLAWHERQISHHMEHLARVRDNAQPGRGRLEAVLQAYAEIHHQRVQRHQHQRHGAELGAFLHRDPHVARAEQKLRSFIRDLLAECVRMGDVRNDVAPEELAQYCLHALVAAGALPSLAAVRRLVAITLTALRPA